MTGGPASCFSNDGLHCSPQSGTCEPLIALGEACVGSQDCAAGAWCDTGTCSAQHAVGESCNGAFGTCAGTASCDVSTQKCAAPKVDGTACTLSDECVNHCVDGKCSSRTIKASFCENPKWD